MSQQLVKVNHGGRSQTIALFSGLESDDLSDLLSTLFGLSGRVLGFTSENGVVLPISLVCRNPQIIPEGTTCDLLVSDESAGNLPPPPVPRTQSSLPPPPPPMLSYNDVIEDETSSSSDDAFEYEEGEEESEEDSEGAGEQDEMEDPTSRAMHEIFRFIASLRSKGILSQEQSVLLEDILFENSTLLFAAYSVAVSAKDAEYFAQICCGIAQSLQTKDGRETCEAQDEVLQACDRLYLAQKINENQLLYLRHLVLIRDETVGDIYDNYSQSEDLADLVRGLYLLAHNHPKPSSASEQEEEDEEEEDEEEEEEEEEESDGSDEDSAAGDDSETDDADEIRGKETIQPQQQGDILMSSRLTAVVNYMFNSRMVDRDEGRILLEMVADGDEYCTAAYEVWRHDGRLEDLCDTLVRCAKLEVRKRSARDSHAAIQAAIAQDPSSYPDYGEESGEDLEDASRSSSSGSGSGSSSSDSEGDDEEAASNSEEEALNSILEVAGITNIWKDSVPQRFVSIVFIAANRQVLAWGQAKALCDLFQAQYDLVHAAWEVYQIEQDARDFIDTLKRIVRELKFDDNGNIEFNIADSDEPESVSIQEAVQKTDTDTSNTGNTGTDSKQEALNAVLSAKRDLLKHSLDMMVKQGLATEEGAASVYKRSIDGDALVDAAIEQYANDRDVAEFLETLQVLAAFTPEQIHELMRDAEDDNDAPLTAAEQEEGAEEVTEEESQVDAEEEESDADADGEDEQKDDNEENFPMNALIELTRKRIISTDMYSALKKLVQDKHAHVLAAFDVFKDMQDAEDLVDTLKRIARHHGAASNDEPAQQRAPETEKENESDSESSSESSSESESESESDSEPIEPGAGVAPGEEIPMLPPSDQKKVVGILGNAGAFSEEQVAILEGFIDSNNGNVRRLFVNYERQRKVNELIQGLSEALPMTPATRDSAASTQPDTDSNNAAKGGDEDSDDSADSDDKPETTLEEVEKKFLAIIKEMKLSHLETAALRLAIARNDVSIRKALEEFRVSVDEATLIENLRDIARNTMVATLEERDIEIIDPDDESDEKGKENSDSNSDSDSESSEEGWVKPSSAEDGDVNGEEKNYEDDFESASESQSETGDAKPEDDPEDEQVMSQAARAHVFPILVSELIKEDIMKQASGEKLLDLFKKENPVISAALDVYDVDNDMAELVDTLQRVVVQC